MAIKQDHKMKPAVTKLAHYMETYDMLPTYEKYSTATYVDDVLYGLAISLSDEYTGFNGYAKFKKDLLEHLGC